MNYKLKNKIIESIIKCQPLYIKDTGVKVKVTYYGSDLREFGTRSRNALQYCNIDFLTSPTTKALKMLVSVHVREANKSDTMDCIGTILLDNLSLTPYDTKAAKLLFKKSK